MKKLLFQILNIITIIKLTSSQISNYIFRLEKGEKECLQDFFPSKTLVIYEIVSNISQIQFTLTQKVDSLQLSKINDYSFKYPFTTYQQGYYEICIYNYDIKATYIYYNLKYGVAAKDYSSIARTKDLKPIDIEIEKLVEKISTLNNKSTFIRQMEKLTQIMLDSISNKLFNYGIMMIIVMIIIGVLETFYLKKFLQKRKII
jgi:hypothetical protein